MAALEDKLAGGANDPASEALWRVHRARMAAAAHGLRVGAPVAGFLRRDPYALRMLLALALLLGAIDAGGDWTDRIRRSLSPSIEPGAAAAGVALDIWVTPPDYTGLPPLFLHPETAQQPVSVPTGSTVLAQVHGGGALPQLALDDKDTAFAKIDDSDFKGSATITAGKRLAVTHGGRTLGAWPITVVPDLPPTIAFAKPPSRTDRGALRLEYKANDDYGVESVKAVIRLKDNAAAPPLVLDLPLPGQHLKDAAAASYHDLTPHPWAGLPVEIELQAVDAIGQTGLSETIETTLPERLFHNPVAKAIIEARKELSRPSRRSQRGGGDIVRPVDPPRPLRQRHRRLHGAAHGAGAPRPQPGAAPPSPPCRRCCGRRRCASRTGAPRRARTICARRCSACRTRSRATRPMPRSIA